MDSTDWPAADFEAHRTHLRAVAYRMLGSLTDADDAVQESWLRLSRADTGDVRDLRAWLTTVVSRVCLDMLRSRASRREDSLDVHVPARSSRGSTMTPPSTRSWPTRSASPCWSSWTRCRPPSGSRSSCTTSSPSPSSRSARSWTVRLSRPSNWPAAPGTASAMPRRTPPRRRPRPSLTPRPAPRLPAPPISPGSGRSSRPSSPPRARATLRGCLPSSTRTSSCGLTRVRARSAPRFWSGVPTR